MCFVGEGTIFEANGGSDGITHLTGTTSTALFHLYGHTDPNDTKTDQEITFNGSSDSDGPIFINLPDGAFGMRGAPDDTCSETSYESDGCEGDVFGAVWAKSYGSNTSASANLQIVVPEGFISDISEYNENYGKNGIPDYVGQGTKEWSSFTVDNQETVEITQ